MTLPEFCKTRAATNTGSKNLSENMKQVESEGIFTMVVIFCKAKYYEICKAKSYQILTCICMRVTVAMQTCHHLPIKGVSQLPYQIDLSSILQEAPIVRIMFIHLKQAAERRPMINDSQ